MKREKTSDVDMHGNFVYKPSEPTNIMPAVLNIKTSTNTVQDIKYNKFIATG